MFFYLPFFTFAAAMLLAFPDEAVWLFVVYITALIVPRLWSRSR